MTNLDVFNNISKQLFNGSTKVFDDIFDGVFDSWSKVKSFPFYNVVKYGKSKYGLELALAGYDKKNVLVEFKNGVLTIEGQIDDKEKEFIHQGLAFRKFTRQFQLRNDVIVDEAEMKNGVLTIKFGVNEPEELEATKIEVK